MTRFFFAGHNDKDMRLLRTTWRASGNRKGQDLFIARTVQPVPVYFEMSDGKPASDFLVFAVRQKTGRTLLKPRTRDWSRT